MTIIDIVRLTIIAIIIIAAFCIIAGYVMMRCEEWLDEQTDEHSNTDESRG